MPQGRRDSLCDVTGARRTADVHDRATLKPGHHLRGPALIVEPQTTTFVSADFRARIDGAGNIVMIRQTEGTKP